MQSDQCIGCKNYSGVQSCEAFKEKIPNIIMTGEFDHSNPYKGDNGIRYKEKTIKKTTIEQIRMATKELKDEQWRKRT